MTGGGSPSAHSEMVLMIMNNMQAAEVRIAVDDHDKQAGRDSPTFARIHRAIVVALQTIWNKPDGWYDAELQVELGKLVKPRLSPDELAKVMHEVHAVIPPRKEDERIKNLRGQRRAKQKSRS